MEPGKHWEQPPRHKILVDERFAVMCKADFERLAEYSGSQPSGVYEGKMWRRFDGSYDLAFLEAGGKPTWLLCWFAPDLDPAKCRTITRKILLTDGDIEVCV